MKNASDPQSASRSICIFDFDGTLADTRQAVVATVDAVLREIHHTIPDAGRIRAQIGLPLKETFIRAAGISDETLLDTCVYLYRELFEQVGAPSVTLFPHALPVLVHLRNEGILLAIASSRGKKSLDSLAVKLGLAPLVTMALGEEDVRHKKPAPDLVLTILERTGTTPGKALITGDTVWDIQMGKSAACHTCAVLWGNGSRVQLEAEKPGYVIDDFRQLPEIANKLLVSPLSE